MLFCDGGTTYSKIYNSDTDTLTIIPTKDLLKEKDFSVDYGTGHLMKTRAESYINELVALAEGGRGSIKDEDYVILDIGSRDTKYVRVQQGEVTSLDWNTSCGGNLGFTVELLGNYYNIDFKELAPVPQGVAVACGLLGIEKIFDEINSGLNAEESVAKFIRGIALNTFNFCQKPKKIYLSGGFSENHCFVNSLRDLTEVEVLGRNVLIKGLISIAKKGA